MTECLKMARNRTLMPVVVLVVLTGGGMLVLSGICSSAAQHDSSYKQIISPRDSERRQQRLGSKTEDKLVDMTAFVGMPEPYSEATSNYVEAVVSSINAEPIKRQRFYHKKRPGRPDDFPFAGDPNPIYDRDFVIPLVLLPRPAAVRRWSASGKARSLDWRTEDEVSQHPGSVYGRTLIFEPGKLSQIFVPTLAIPFEDTYDWDLGYLQSQFVLDLRKVVVAPDYDVRGELRDQAAALRVGAKDGAKLLGEFMTVPAYLQNGRLRWVTLRTDSGIRRFLAYALLDGNGGARPRDDKSTHSRISAYVRPLICNRHQPKIKQHDELLLPTPLGWPPTEKDLRETKLEKIPHEEWCLDDWFPAQKDSCWVIREAKDSKPLQESFLLMPASEPSDRPVFFIALFAETEPKQLVQELATLYKVSPDAALNSSETMERLNALYEKVRDFPLAK
ncbi:MAG: hypothetical protein IAG10_14670 [Planctomycetaceae bacterium]|nr:hypothetical protein [Planctomycetaceae bacterium]